MANNEGYDRNNPRAGKRSNYDDLFWQNDGKPFVYCDHSGRPIFRVQRQLGYRNQSHTQPVIDDATGKHIKCSVQKWLHTPKGLKPQDAPALLYQLPELIAAVRTKTIYIVEGEPKVEALRKWGLIATCNDGGAGKWRREHAAWLAGADVIILPDNDAPGRRHADLIGRSLDGIATRRRLLELPNLPEHGDIKDWIAAGGTQAEFKRLAATAPEWKPYGADALELVHGAGLEPEALKWLWQGRIPCGSLTLLAGLSGVGKSQLACDVTARITTGRSFPPEPERSDWSPAGSVLMVGSEDRLRHTLVPRLMAAGADMNRVEFLRIVTTADGKRRGLDLTQDIERIRATLMAHPDIVLMVFDPISQFLGIKIDSHNNTMVRAALGPLTDLLDECEVAALGITHTAKAKGGAVQNAAIGSVGFAAIARSNLLVFEEEEDEVDDDGAPVGDKTLTGRLLLTVSQTNNARPEDKQTLAYTIINVELPDYEHIDVSRVEWHEAVAVSAHELWQNTTKKPTAKGDAIKFIKQAMRDPEQPNGYRDRLSAEMEDEAAAVGISKGTLKRAKQDLNIRSHQNGGAGPWWWEVPNPWRTKL
jgi:putative DNA primase/helicase